MVFSILSTETTMPYVFQSLVRVMLAKYLKGGVRHCHGSSWYAAVWLSPYVLFLPQSAATSGKMIWGELVVYLAWGAQRVSGLVTVHLSPMVCYGTVITPCTTFRHLRTSHSMFPELSFSWP